MLGFRSCATPLSTFRRGTFGLVLFRPSFYTCFGVSFIIIGNAFYMYVIIIYLLSGFSNILKRQASNMQRRPQE